MRTKVYTCNRCGVSITDKLGPDRCMYCDCDNFTATELPETTPTFTRLADVTLDRCKATYQERGQQYADTWAKPPLLALRAVLRELGYGYNEKHLKAIVLAALVDVKYVRLMGGYKDDSIIDGINYAAVLAQEMREIEAREGEA